MGQPQALRLFRICIWIEQAICTLLTNDINYGKLYLVRDIIGGCYEIVSHFDLFTPHCQSH